MVVDLTVVRRLAFIRYLHHLGTEQSHLPRPLSSASILMLHDAVEEFLVLTAEHVGVTPPTQFEKYWDAVKPKLKGGAELALMQGMRRLNKARVGLKHHGLHPDQSSIEQAVIDTNAFFAANSPLVFGIDYDSISMADVIPQAVIREAVGKAEQEHSSGNHIVAMAMLHDAFEILLKAHTKKGGGRREAPSPFLFGPELSWHDKLDARKIAALFETKKNTSSWDVQKLAKMVRNTADSIDALRAAMQITAWGLAYADYLRFSRLLPSVVGTANGQLAYIATASYSPTNDDFQYCLQFVVTAALRSAEIEASVQPPPWLDTQKNEEWITVLEARREDQDGMPVDYQVPSSPAK